MKIAVIGAGVAGLASLRRSLVENHDCVAFEQSDKIGGTWNYTDQIGADDYGLPVHSSMYQGLMTNLPKELMEFEDFPYEEKGNSFIGQLEVIEYVNRFAERFDLLPHIKFLRHVLKVDPIGGGKWQLTEKDIRSGNITEHIFDAILVCVGNYSVPKLPEIQGMETFTGRSVHSHSYRRPDDYKGKRVLVVGAGPSGVDISRILSDVAERVFLSLDGVSFAKIGASVVQKPLVVKLEGDRALFSDESQETIDDIIYCTGYQYSYPFLTERCGITVENNWVKCLYKHVVNVAHPTMGFIGVTFKVCPFPVVGVQVRFFLTLLGGRVKIDKEAMLDEVLKDMRRRKEMGWPEHHAHKIGLEQRAYVNDLADTGKIYRLKPVVCSLYEHLVEHRNDRKRFRILNDEEFEEF